MMMWKKGERGAAGACTSCFKYAVTARLKRSSDALADKGLSPWASRGLLSFSKKRHHRSGSTADRLEQSRNLAKQTRDFDWLGIVIFATHFHRLLAIAGHGVRGERDHRNPPSGIVGLDPTRCLPTVDHRQAHVHQDEVGPLRQRHIGALLPIHRDRDLVAVADESARKHVAVHLIVFDQQNSWHRVLIQLAMRSASWTGRLARRARTAAATSIRYDGSLAMIRSACPLRTPKSSAVSSFAVTTMTGISANAGPLRNSRRNSKPSISGINRSSKIKLGAGWLSIQSKALRPFTAAWATYPIPVSIRQSVSRVGRSSSTTRIETPPEAGQCARRSAARRCRSTGLVRKSAAPNGIAMPRSLRTVTMITGMSRSAASALSSLSALQPSICGINTSRVIACGRCWRASESASTPLLADMTR